MFDKFIEFMTSDARATLAQGLAIAVSFATVTCFNLWLATRLCKGKEEP